MILLLLAFLGCPTPADRRFCETRCVEAGGWSPQTVLNSSEDVTCHCTFPRPK